MKKGCVLRIDNILRPGTYKNFKQIMDVINSNHAKAVIDVTPRWHGSEQHNKKYVSSIKKELDRGHSLALHGIEHRCRILEEKDHQLSWLPSEDEFDCKDYHRIHGHDIPVEIQKKWLREGNDLLYSVFEKTTDLLMPPAHAYNNNTLKAMITEGFKGISDYGRWDACPYQKEGITIFPFDFEDYMKNTREDGANKEAMKEMFTRYFTASVKQQGYYATFIHVDFSGDGFASQERLNMLNWMIGHVKSQGHNFIDPHDLLISKS